MGRRKGKSKGVVKRLFHDMGSDRRKLYFVIMMITISKVLLSIAPKVSGTITDQITVFAKAGEFDMKWLGIMCLILGTLYLVGYGAEALIGNVIMGVSQNLVKKLRDRGQKKFNRLSIRYMDSHPTGDIMSRLTSDMQYLSNALESTLGVLIGQMILLIGVVIMMFVTNPILTLVYIVVLPLGFLASGGIVFLCVKLVRQQRKLTGKLTSIATDSYSNFSMIKAYSCEAERIEAFNKVNTAFYKKYVKAQFLIGFIMPASIIVSNIAYILECIIGGAFLIRGKITLGEFQAFLIYGNMVLSPLTALSTAVHNIQNGLISAERIYELLDEEEETNESHKPSLDVANVNGQINFEHVKFGYIKGKTLMQDVSIETKAGQTVAIVGPTGAGKTTMINLLMRFYDIDGGFIKIDGQDISSISRKSLRQSIGIVLQDSWIFDGTIAENIAYGKPEATRDEIIEIAKLTHCDAFINKLENGYDTHINEEKAQLSSGEKQLLSIARTMIADPAILILDEATSQVDTRTELIITKAMENLMKGRTCFVIAHRLFTIKNADLILYMEDGDIKEVGNHNTLMYRNGKYANLYKQAANHVESD